MPAGVPGSTADSTSDYVTEPAAGVAQQPSSTEATTFFSLPRELRDLIYYYLCGGVYTQMRVDALLRNLRLDQPNGGHSSPARQITVLQASRRLWEEGSRILFRENLFRFHVGLPGYNTTLLDERTTDLMHDIEINLHPSKALESVRVLRLFGGSQILRKSCSIKLQFRKVELISNSVIEALKNMTGFEVLTFEIEVPGIVSSRLPEFSEYGAPIPWVSELLAFIKANLTLALGPGTYANHQFCRRLIFRPLDMRKFKTRVSNSWDTR